MRAIVDQDTCTGCELCTETCPEVFEMQNDTAVEKVDVVPPEAEETCREAAEDCPVEAITIEE
jgi:ferredoxin